MILKKIWITLVGVIVTIIFIFPIIIVGLFNTKKNITGILCRYWAKCILVFCFVNYNIIYKSKLSSKNNYIFISNHQSAFDILVSFALLDVPLAFFTKKELFNIPVFGWALKSSGMVYVDRQNKEKSKKSVTTGLNALQNTKLSLLIYPEGTRTYYTFVDQFKKGAFILAINSNKDVVPLTVMYNKNPIMNPWSLNIRLLVDNPISTLNYNVEQKEVLLVKVSNIIKSNLEIMKN